MESLSSSNLCSSGAPGLPGPKKAKFGRTLFQKGQLVKSVDIVHDGNQCQKVQMENMVITS